MKQKYKRRSISIITFMLCFSIFQHFALAQKDGDDVVMGKYRQLYSKILNEDRLLLVHLPSEYAETPLNYPVLYLLYGHDIHNYFADAVIISEKLGGSGEIPPLIIIGVGNTNRYRDNLPKPIEGRNDSGGADNFLKFFQEELIPFVETNYRTKDFRIIAGPQAGAVFGFYALLEKPDLFNAVLSENPFMNPPNAEFLFPLAEAVFKNTPRLNNFLYIKCEKNERALDLDYAKKLDALLGDYKPEGFRYSINIVDPSGYFIPPLPFLDGLRTLFFGHKLPEDFVTNSVHDVINYYKDLSEKTGCPLDPPSLMLTFEGDKLNQRSKINEAIELFEFQLKLYPKSLNALWRLGETYRGLGDFERARDYYKAFLEIRSIDAAMIDQRLQTVEKILSDSAAYRIEQEINKEGIKAGIKMFTSIKKDPENRLYFDENEFNSMGYRLMGKGQIKEAIEIFLLNVSMYPNSANVYDSLGEAYMVSGDIKKAINNYKKSLELNPKNTNAIEMLKKLEKKF